MSSEVFETQQTRASAPSPRDSPILAWGMRLSVVVALAASGALLTRTPPAKEASASTSHPDASPADTNTRRVSVASVQETEVGGSIELTGVIRANSSATTSFLVPGRITRRAVEVGQLVEKGDIIATLDARAYRHKVEGARARLASFDASLAKAEIDHRRAAALVASDAATQAQLDAATTAREQLRAARAGALVDIREAKRLLAEATLRAPIRGEVVAVSADMGEFVNVGQPIVSLSGDTGLKVELGVPERHIPSLKEGERVSLSFPNLDRSPVLGTLRSVADAATGTSLFTVVIDLPEDAKLRPGMTVSATLEGGISIVNTVPMEAISGPSGRSTSVLAVREGHVRRVPIRLTGYTFGERVAILGELRLGEQVITAGHAGLTDGVKVEVVP